MKRIIAWIIILMLVIPGALAEEEEEEIPTLYSMSKNLQGRIRPGKKYEALTSFDMWTPLKPTGRMSEDRMWVEIRTWEDDLVWCNINYLTETQKVLHVYTLWESGVKIRSAPGGGRVTGTARREQMLEITQVVLGYGRCSKGWIELDYFIIDE